ncbi:MAG: DUF4124 domain-containing protein [Proteobacteria bacterium]|nr:DUF4124 domain-containing protein [Pseudomonadota bacterium]
MKPRLTHIPLVVLALTPALGQADIYKCTGSDGHVTYSNVPSKDCKRLTLDPVPAAPPAKAGGSARTPTPSTVPRVDDSTQGARDSDRRRILESELATEQKNLEQARATLTEQEGIILPSERNVGGTINSIRVQERLQPLRDKAALHERNIEAIRKEISNLR